MNGSAPLQAYQSVLWKAVLSFTPGFQALKNFDRIER
jgi:hypothetical protein